MPRFVTLLAAAALLVLPRGGGSAAPPDAPRAPGASPCATGASSLDGTLRLRAEVALRRAVDWLLASQEADGSWRSGRYGVLRGGQAYTPFVLHALLSVPPQLRNVPATRIDRAATFIRSRVDASGALGYHDRDLLEYPVYATAYAILALRRTAPTDPAIPRMARWLAGMQLVEAKGFDASSPAYGGWGFGVRSLAPGDPGHMDVAHTRRALQALSEAGVLAPESAARALRFLGLLQKRSAEIARFPGIPAFPDDRGDVPFDGGFFFSPIVLAANKALWQAPSGARAAHFRSYATPTSDGVLALLAAGADRHDERVRAAEKWLAASSSVEVTGIPADHPEPWDAALRFYHMATYAEAASALGLIGWEAACARKLLELQDPDGSFVNRESTLMKEDDPVLATTFAVVALGRVVSSHSRHATGQ